MSFVVTTQYNARYFIYALNLWPIIVLDISISNTKKTITEIFAVNMQKTYKHISIKYLVYVEARDTYRWILLKGIKLYYYIANYAIFVTSSVSLLNNSVEFSAMLLD